MYLITVATKIMRTVLCRTAYCGYDVGAEVYEHKHKRESGKSFRKSSDSKIFAFGSVRPDDLPPDRSSLIRSRYL